MFSPVIQAQSSDARVGDDLADVVSVAQPAECSPEVIPLLVERG